MAAPTSVTMTSAHLSGEVYPAGQETSYHFEYGPTASYGSTTPESDELQRLDPRVSTAHPAPGRRVRFTGTVAPPVAGVPFAIQRLTEKGWATVAGGKTRATAYGVAAYGKTVPIGHDGDYRVYVRMGDGILPDAGFVKKIRPRSR